MASSQRQVAVLDPRAFDDDVVHALILVTLEAESSQHHADLRERLSQDPAVQQCYAITGEWDYAVVLAATGAHELRQAVSELFMDDVNVKRFVTLPMHDIVKTCLEIPAREKRNE